jgi:hypothetical protein
MDDQKRLIEVEKEITKAEEEGRAFKTAYEDVINPTDKIGFHRSIWSAPPAHRDPFTDAVKKLNTLSAERRALRGKLGVTR